MKSILLCCAVLATLKVTWADGAGRAFPVEAENYVIELFKEVNPQINWDPTNFLVDMSGNYANCAQIGNKGFTDVEAKTPDGFTIGGIQDYTAGSAADVDAVNGYIRSALSQWVDIYEYREQIATAERFGCSVRPACSGYASIACLFSPGYNGNPVIQPTRNPGEEGGIEALAFTPEQYRVAEGITGQRWDRSHFLENLSGSETSCSMIGKREWYFSNAINVAADRGMKVTGHFGYARNVGSTQDPMEAILKSFKYIPAKQVGCSVIPDCMVPEGNSDVMYVVVSCLYEE